MAATANQTTILNLIAGMFDAAPGATFLAEFEAALASAGSINGLAAILGETATFEGLYAAAATNTAFATSFIDNLVGNEADATAKAWAVSWVEAQLNAGASRTDVMVTVITELAAIDPADVTWGNAQKALANQVAASEVYSIDDASSSTDLATLQAITADVTSDVSTVPDTFNFTIANGLVALDAAQDAVTAFLVTADGDDDELTSTDSAALTLAASDAVDAIGALVDPSYAAASAGVQTALLADENSDLADDLATAQTRLTDANADIAAVTGLGELITAHTAAVDASDAADAALALEAIALTSAVSTYDLGDADVVGVVTVVTGLVTTVADAAPVTLLELDADSVLALATGITEADYPGVTVLLAAYTSHNDAFTVADDAATAEVDALAALTLVDRSEAANVDLAELGAAMTVVTPADVAAPTQAEIDTEVAGLAAVKTTADTALADAQAANTAADTPADVAEAADADAIAAEAADALVITVTNSVATIQAALEGVAWNADEGTTELAFGAALQTYVDAGTLNAADRTAILNAITAANTIVDPAGDASATLDAAAAAGVALIAANNQIITVTTAADLTDAGALRTTADLTDAVALRAAADLTDAAEIAATTAVATALSNVNGFNTLVGEFNTTVAANEAVVELGNAESDVEDAEDAITALADAVAASVAADADVAALAVLTGAVTAVEADFTTALLEVPVTLVSGANSASANNDIFLADDTVAASSITNFGLLGGDTLYIGTDLTLNSGAIADDGDNAVLEVFLTEVAGDTLITMETEAFGSNSAEVENVITLTGVSVDDVTLANGFITVA